MRTLFAFLRKELTEQLRTGRLMMLGILFVLFGIMNPAIAKLTPWILELMADSLAESGMIVTGVEVSAMDSWVQFYKNMPMGLIAFVLIESSIFTKEYQTGTLLLSLTKGLKRHKVMVSKTAMLITLWTICYWLCFGITYWYNAYFWDNSIAKNLMFSVLCWWIFGLWVIAWMVLFSVIAKSNTGVLIGTGAIVLIVYLIGLFPTREKYLPTLLSDGYSLIYGLMERNAYIIPIVITVAVSVLCVAFSIPIFNKKEL